MMLNLMDILLHYLLGRLTKPDHQDFAVRIIFFPRRPEPLSKFITKEDLANTLCL
jgi:hypothetical protein